MSSEASDTIRLTGTARERHEQMDPYWIAIINELPIGAHGYNKEEAVAESVKALSTYMKANNILGQIGSVMERLGYSGELGPGQYYKRFTTAYQQFITGPGEVIWEDPSASGEQQFEITLII